MGWVAEKRSHHSLWHSRHYRASCVGYWCGRADWQPYGRLLAAGHILIVEDGAGVTRVVRIVVAWKGYSRIRRGRVSGMDKERTCTQAGVEAAYWLISGSGSQREEELYKRFFLPNLISADVDPESTAHWINHGDPPFTAVPVDIAADILGTKIDDNAIGCVVSLDGKEHGKENIPNSSDPYPDSGVLYLRLNRKDKDSAWFVMSIDYNPEDYQRDIKQQGNN
ncbi:hypothetical protein HMPREF9017_00236 [Parascardovia denticolens F0305]|nr:hypothetical protein HMPREF9017_00236 [Parascardovia denticolens F0305]